MLGSVPASAADNAAPDFDGHARPGDNVYTATLLVIEPKTGKLRSHHQQVPHDVWDFDWLARW